MTEVPHSVEHEAATLGAVFLHPGGKVAQMLAADLGLRPEHFYRERHAWIWEAMLGVLDRGESMDLLTVGAELKRRGYQVSDVDVDALAAHAPTPEGIRGYAERVVDLAEWRAKLRAGHGILEAVGREDRDALAEAEGLLLHVSREERAAIPAARMADRLFEFMERGEVESWPLPWHDMTQLLAGGLKRKTWTVLGGHSSHGKSVVGGMIAESVAREFQRRGSGQVRVYLAEGNAEEWALRAISRHSGLNFGRLVQGKLREGEHARYAAALTWWRDLGIVTVPAAGWTPEHVARDVRTNRPDLWVVDLLNELDVGRGETSDWDRAVRTLGALPQATDSHGLVLAHVNEARVQTKRPKPTLGDLRSTGMLKNAADQVVFVWREQSDDGTELYPESEVYVAKARNALLGGVLVDFQGTRQRFVLRSGE